MRSSITTRGRVAGAVVSSPPRSSAQTAVRSPSGRGAAADQRDLDRASHPSVVLPGVSGADGARLPAGIGGSAFGPRLQAAVVTLTARHRVSRRGICELARDLFGARLSTGSVDAICQRASDALAGPHLQLQDWVLDQGAVHVDETGWRTAAMAARCGPRPPRMRRSSRSLEHCNREQFNVLVGSSYPGIVISDRWNGYSHLDPNQRQVCWSHIQRDFARHADGLGEQKTFGEHGLELTRQVFAAWRAYQHEHHDRERLKAEIAPIQTELRRLLEDASPKSRRTRWHRSSPEQPAQGLARALDLHHHRRGRADQQPRRARAPRPRHPPKSLARHPKRHR